MWAYLIDNPATAAALLAAIATVFAAVATLFGPIVAARIAERMRHEGEARSERRRTRFWIFTVLMQERASIASPDAVRALNLIDVVYSDCGPVRDAWAELYSSFDNSKNVPLHVREERLRRLLREMAQDLHLAEGLRPDDFNRVYYPNAQAEEDYRRDLERKAAIARLAGPTASSTEAAEPATKNLLPMFPPKPSEVGPQ